MRTIEKEMIEAIKESKNFSKSNTKVIRYNDNYLDVVLYNTTIAEIRPDKVILYTGGYQTVTTKSRLNAILSIYGYYISQENYTWKIYKNNEYISPMYEGFYFNVS